MTEDKIIPALTERQKGDDTYCDVAVLRRYARGYLPITYIVSPFLGSLGAAGRPGGQVAGRPHSFPLTGTWKTAPSHSTQSGGKGDVGVFPGSNDNRLRSLQVLQVYVALAYIHLHDA